MSNLKPRAAFYSSTIVTKLIGMLDHLLTYAPNQSKSISDRQDSRETPQHLTEHVRNNSSLNTRMLMNRVIM